MRYKLVISAFISACCLLAATVLAQPTVTIDDSGFYQDPSNQYGWADDFTADFNSGDPDVEIPDDQLSYSWSIQSVQVDPNFGTDYVTADPDDYDASFTDADQQDSTLHAEVYSGGNWLFTVEVTVNYPDGYCRVYYREFQGRSETTRLAGGEKVDGERNRSVNIANS